jgi:hypothetical protein
MGRRTLAMPVLASAALLSSGLLMVVASAERWWPMCRPGLFDTDACLTRQDHLYDFVFVAEPWTAVGSAAEFAGISMLLLASAMAVLPSVLSRRPRPLTWVIGAVLAVGNAFVGLHALLSGLNGEVVSLPGPIVSGAFASMVIFWPAWATAWWLIAVSGADWRPRNWWGLALAVTLMLASPGALFILVGPMVVNYVSHDTTPWTEAVGGCLLVLAAALVWPAVLRPERRRSPGAAPAPIDADGRVSTQPPVTLRRPRTAG